jgi:virulence factor Mce-like protein
MHRLSSLMVRVVVGAVVVAVVAGVAVYALLSGGGTRTITAQFSSAVGIYPGTPVDILGVPVGSVQKVTPSGDHVTVELAYDSKYQVPANPIAVIVANSLVSDRYIQLAPVYSGHGPTLSDGATIPMSRTAAPAELDDIYAALDKLSVALGPQGTNKNGALNTFVKVAAANLQGNGQALGDSITQLSKAAKTLADGRGDLFGTVRNLQQFTQALADSDQQVRHFEEQLANVAGQLADERGDLGTALHELSTALNSVADFVNTNAGKLHTDLHGLAKISQILVDENSSINEMMAVAPVALANLVHAYQPDLGVLGTRSNVASLSDPSQFCGLISGITNQLLGDTKYSGASVGTILNALGSLLGADGPLAPLGNLLGPASDLVVKTCLKYTGGKSTTDSGLPDVGPAQLASLLESLVGNGLGGLIGVGGGGK